MRYLPKDCWNNSVSFSFSALLGLPLKLTGILFGWQGQQQAHADEDAIQFTIGVLKMLEI
jgi:hypothetical protein